MNIKHGIVGAIVLAVSTATATAMDLGCLHLVLDPAKVACTGTLAPVVVTIENACPETKRVSITFALDREPLRAQSASTVPSEHELQRTVMVEIPERIAPGTHALTVTARDIEGNSNRTSEVLIVDECVVVGSLVKK